jgi:type I restriction enzyme, S subunit
MIKRFKFYYSVINDRAGNREFPLLSVSARFGVVPRRTIAEGPSRAEDLSNYKVCHSGDIVLNRMSAYQGAVGRSSQTGIVSPDYIILRPNSEVDSRYLHHFIRSDWLVGQMTSRLRGIGSSDNGGVRTPRINPEDLGGIQVDIPSLDEQRRIADFLDAETARIDQLVDKKQRVITLIDERAQALLNKITPGELAFGVDGKPIGIAGMKCVRLGAIAEVHGGFTMDSGRDTTGDSVTLPYLRVANVQDGALALDDVKEVTLPRPLARRCVLRPGDVLMTEGGDPDKLGRGTVWPGDIEPCLHQNAIFAVRPNQNLLPEYLALVTRTRYARAYFEMTSSKATGIAHTSSTKITSFRVPMRTIADQQQIILDIQEALARIDALRAPAERQLALLADRRQALITAAVTGGITV